MCTVPCQFEIVFVLLGEPTLEVALVLTRTAMSIEYHYANTIFNHLDESNSKMEMIDAFERLIDILRE